MGLGPLALMLKRLKTFRLGQLARLQKYNQPASFVNTQRLKKPELSTVTVKLPAITAGQGKRGEKSFLLKGLGLDLTVQSQVIQCQARLAVTRSRHVPLTVTQIMAVTILIGTHQDIIVVVVAGLALV